MDVPVRARVWASPAATCSTVTRASSRASRRAITLLLPLPRLILFLGDSVAIPPSQQREDSLQGLYYYKRMVLQRCALRATFGTHARSCAASDASRP